MRLPAPLLAVLPALAAVVAVAAASASSVSSGCGAKTAPIPLSTRHNVTLASGNRTFMYFLPATYDPSTPTPLILSFHGATRTSDWQADLDGLTDPYFNPDHIMVYPQALQFGNTTDYIFWQGSPGTGSVDDVGYVGDVLDLLESQLCVDLTRVYATGKSQGAGMTGVLACDHGASRRIAAFAPVSGAFYQGAIGCANPDAVPVACDPGRPKVPVLDFHGGNDTTISINGGLRSGACLPSIVNWVSRWIVRNGLPASSVSFEALPGTALIRRWGAGDDAGLVTWVYDGTRVNHDWPATYNNTDSVAHLSGPATFNASTMIMKYFAKYTLPLEYVTPSTSSNATSSASISIPTSTSVATVTPTATVVPVSTNAGNRAAGSLLWGDRLSVAAIWGFLVGGLLLL